MPTHVRLDGRAKFAKSSNNGRRKILFGIIENRDFQIVVLFCLVGLVAFFTVAIHFPNLGAMIAEYNQF